MKKLVLVTFEEKAKALYWKQLKDFFGDLVEITACSVEAGCSFDLAGADIVLLSFADITHYVSGFVCPENQILYMTRSFEREKLKALDSLANGERVGLADYSEAMAFETVGILNSCGYNYIDYRILLPETDDATRLGIRTMITTENVVHIPPEVERVINIGWYKIGWTTFAELARRMDILTGEINRKLSWYSGVVPSPNQGIVDAIKYTWTTEKQLAAVLESMTDTALITDLDYHIVQFNSGALELMNLDQQQDGCAPIRMEQLPGSLWKFLRTAPSIHNSIFSMRETGKTVVASRKTISLYGEPRGYLFLLRNVNEIQKLENDYRIMTAQKGFCAKFSFDDIITESEEMKRCIEICKKIAATDLAILITGESGVGKEMFAQSIHHHSQRSPYPFVAVNCAALPKDLLESELFGFEEGAFTGARKGGKKGLFELAHKGTVFLDEVGDMPLSTQAKLLRVLQEKEVMRLGGTSVTPIDVRVISASNVDFAHLFEERLFRRDLYYRLNNAKVRIPSLSERREDIPLLCRIFGRNGAGETFSIENELVEALARIRWDGNVRELKNCMDYMTALNPNGLSMEDLPAEYLEQAREKTSVPRIGDMCLAGSHNDSPDSPPFALMPDEAKLLNAVIRILEQRNLGRRRLKAVLESQGVIASEYKIKMMIDLLKQHDLLPQAGKEKRGGRMRKDKTV